MSDQPMQLGPNHHQMDAPSDVTTWTTIKTTRNVVSDDGRGMTLRDEWWDVPSFVVDTLLAALPPAPPLDVERLAKSLMTTDSVPMPAGWRWYQGWAERIAREYAALGEER